ncbi:MAG: response regulator, partial [Chitinispirillaceae bacterium]|nr:response regulator [Chitinispirillaceae bacterium]
MKKILIVDDSREVRRLVGTTLSFKNFKIYEAPNGVKAVEMAEKYHPDLIIMDISMPGTIDGIEATKRIRAIPALNETSILILSGVI